MLNKMNFSKLHELYKNINESTRALLTSREKIEKIKKEVLEVVETLLEGQISEDAFITSCKMLSQSDYSDVIEERNILGICGYPLCAKEIKISSRKYHISCKTKKVYDITERKCFCSNECFMASKFVKLQLSPEPLWLQTEPVNVQLLSDQENSGSRGEEILFQVRKPEEDINSHQVIDNSHSNGIESVLLGELSECASKFKELTIREKEQADLLLNEDACLEQQGGRPTDNHQSDSESESIDSDDSIDSEQNVHKKSQPSTKMCNVNNRVFSSEQSPLLRKSKYGPAVLIEPLPMKVAQRPKLLKCGIPLLNIHKILQEWMTLQSLELLLGKDHVQSAQSRSFEDFITEESQDDGISKMQLGFEKLCLKIDAFEKEEEEIDAILLKESSQVDAQFSYATVEDDHNETLSDKVEVVTTDSSQQVADVKDVDQMPMKRPQRKTTKVDKKANLSQKSRKKTVRFSADTKDEKDEANGNVREPLFPLIESLSRGAVQHQIVTEKLKIAFGHLLPLIGLHFKNISADLRALLTTFSFSPNNITYSPSGWKSIALVLLRLLEKISSHCDKSVFCELLSKTQVEIGTVEEIDQLVTDVTNVDNFLKG